MSHGVMERALLPVENDKDRMQPVVECTIPIAKALDTTVTLYHVFTEDRYADLLDGMDVKSPDPDNLAKRNETVQHIAGRLKDEGVSVEIHGSVGEPAAELPKYVESNDIDHIFMGGRRRSPTRKAIFGSVSQQTLVSVDVPCTITME